MERGINQYITASKRAGFKILSGSEDDEIKNLAYRIFLNRIFYIEHNYLVFPVLRFKNNLNFDVFRQIDRNIGAFSLEPPMLFYSQDVEFASRKKTPEGIDSMANNIFELKNILKNDYNLTLLYVIIPDKYSVYNDYVSGEYEYSGFIPGLTKKLSEKNVYTMDLYTEFMEFKKRSPEIILYNKSDSHFNEHGKKIFLEMIGKTVEGMEKKINN
jgi:hypothetical protein